jgi:glycosyltransferase involved in cell wall biosynthesis
MRFHSLAVPHNICNPDFVACAYQQKVLKFARMMTARGHEVITYGVEGMQTDSTEQVVVVDRDTFESVYGDHDYRTRFFRYDTTDLVYQTFYRTAIAEIAKRKQPNDFILPWWGSGHRPICDAHPDLITVEPGIGYAGGHWARWKVWESYAILHAYYGLQGVGTCTMDYYNRVIPNYFDPADFDYRPLDKKDYLLYLGRVYSGKGVDIAIQMAEATGCELVIAGQGTLDEAGYQGLPGNIHHVGYADRETRRRLMAEASAAIIASKYVEPFGGVQVENLFSGTPTITSDIGAFAENNPHGVTGFRCNTFDDFCTAWENRDLIDPAECRDYAMSRFSLEAVAPKYESFFQDVLNVYTGSGWYQRR